MMDKGILTSLNYIGHEAKVETGMFPLSRPGRQKNAKSGPVPAIMGGVFRKVPHPIQVEVFREIMAV